MRLIIHPEIFESHPQTTIGTIIARNIIPKESPAELIETFKSQQQRIRNEFKLETLSAHPKIFCWREAYRKFGAKPSEYPSSIENLYKRILKGNDIRSVNALVDAYNFISLKHTLPAGGEDLDKVEGGVHLRVAGENETPVNLLGEAEPRAPYKNEIIYADEKGTMCRRWNWKETERTKLTNETKTALLVVEGIAPITREEIRAAVEELNALIGKYLGAQTTMHILDAKTPSIEL